jgi:hypothetical protein
MWDMEIVRTLCTAQNSYKFDAVLYADNTRVAWQKQKRKLNSKNNLFIENDTKDKLAIVEMDNVFIDSESVFQERASDKNRYIYKKAEEFLGRRLRALPVGHPVKRKGNNNEKINR